MSNLKFIDNIYWSKSLRFKKHYTLWKLKHECKLYSLYLLVIPEKEDSMLEIMNASYISQEYYQIHPLLIAGVVKNTNEANEVLLKILSDCFKSTGKYNIKNFLLKEEKKDS